MKKPIIFTLVTLIILMMTLSSVSATLTDNIEYYEMNVFQKIWYSLTHPVQQTITGDTTVSPGSTKVYTVLLDSSPCMGVADTIIQWRVVRVAPDGLSSTIVYPTVLNSPSSGLTIVGLYYGKMSHTFGIAAGIETVAADITCSKGSVREFSTVKVAVACTSECTSGQKKCRDISTRQNCEQVGSCFVWGSAWTCAPDEKCDAGNCIKKDQCTSGTKRCLNSNQFQTCGLSLGAYVYLPLTGQNCPSGKVCSGAGNCVIPCIDTDGGNKPGITGTVTMGEQSTYPDKCDASVLTEYFCDGTALGSNSYNCNQIGYSGCDVNTGKCIASTPTPTPQPCPYNCCSASQTNYVEKSCPSGQTCTVVNPPYVCTSVVQPCPGACCQNDPRYTNKNCPSGQTCDQYGFCIAPPPTCTATEGWKCKDASMLAYQSADCTWSQESACDNGCENGDCKEPSQCTGTQPTQPCDAATWKGYPNCRWDETACQNTCTADKVVTCPDKVTKITLANCVGGKLKTTTELCPSKNETGTGGTDGETTCSDNQVKIGKECVDTICSDSQVKIGEECVDNSMVIGIIVVVFLVLITAVIMIYYLKPKKGKRK